MSVRVLLALHFHQPVGNFDSVFRDAVRLCYAPLLDRFERHPGVRAAFHLSGCLLEWLEEHDRPLLDRVFRLVASGRVEPLGGAFYEPILPIIPRADALDQIERLAAYWQKRGGVRPGGAWIAERVWEPSLAECLAEAGVRYTILDDQHLRFAGLLDERFSGAFVTERASRAIAFLPSDFQLRYLIPFRPLEVLRQHFRELAGQGREWVLTYGDDAEKFGLWPRTHRWVFEEGWLDGFLSMLEEEAGPVRSSSPGAYLDEGAPARRVYVPNASYTEMLEWALPAASVPAYARTRAAALKEAPAEEVRAFVRGSLWDMFLARYPEADQLHKHVLWSSRRARALHAAAPGRAEAITAVLRAQCNCPYWHGLFGGLYFPHLRHGAYQSLLRADALLAQADEGRVRVEVEDLDGDLEKEVVVRSATTQAFFRPSDAGALVELDYLPCCFNIANVVSRWRERYHEGEDLTHHPAEGVSVVSPHERAVGVRAADLKGRHFDRLPLRSLRDFFCSRPPSPAALAGFSGMQLMQGRLERWEATGGGLRSEARLGPLTYVREVTMDASGELRAAWRPAVAGPDATGWLGTLLCLTLLARQSADRATVVRHDDAREVRGAPGDPIEAERVARLTLEDRAFGFALDITPVPAAHLVACPIETLQRSEDRLETTYQGTVFALCWALPPPGAPPPAPELRLAFRRLT
ncbi:MAG: hypothetical protein AUH92_02225 [Acidobacteria bacterium 13_1_40CM_4_69_4]|nr:MAG: hypothetical protein AUH92_02225 [Acidobacteria bacterium 13_1_40CM_4_69_4]